MATRRPASCARLVPTGGCSLAGALAHLLVLVSICGCVDQPLVALEHRSVQGTGGSSGGGQGGKGDHGGTDARTLGGSTGTVVWSWGGGTGQSCSPAEGGCLSEADCCPPSLTCSRGRCTQPQLQCLKADSTCSSKDAACCSGKCEYGPFGGPRTCTAVSGCQPVGEACEYAWECCSGDCNAKVCSPTRRCLLSGETRCNLPGGAECCPETACTSDRNGVSRCTPVPRQCAPQGWLCSHDEACCSSGNHDAVCLLNEATKQRTCAYCASVADPCGGGVGCCAGSRCSGGVCITDSSGTGGAGSVTTSTAPACVPYNQNCSAGECCNGLYCDANLQVCVSKP